MDGDMAGCAFAQETGDDRAAQRAGSAGHDDISSLQRCSHGITLHWRRTKA
jgi:hypothetical protein